MKNKLIFSLLFLLLFPLTAWSNPHDLEIFNNDKFARPKMKNMCSVCHENPNGGGTRNVFGIAFEENNEKITNDIRKKFPELFDLAKLFSPRINRVKPSVFIVGQETQAMIIGANFAEDSILHIDNVSLESTPHIQHTVVSLNRIDVTVTFDKAGKHTFHIATPSGQVSNVFKVIAKPPKI